MTVSINGGEEKDGLAAGHSIYYDPGQLQETPPARRQPCDHQETQSSSQVHCGVLGQQLSIRFLFRVFLPHNWSVSEQSPIVSGGDLHFVWLAMLSRH